MLLNRGNFDNVESIGLALVCGDVESKQNHIAILYKPDGGAASLLHVGFPVDMYSSRPTPKYSWTDLGSSFLPYEKELLNAHAKRIATVNDLVVFRYGFDSNGHFFNRQTGKFESSLPNIGLTCSVFVLEVFSSYDFELLDWDDWELSKPKNIKWQRGMIKKMLTECMHENITPDFIERQETNIGSRRYLPEEVCAAALGKIPAKKKKVKKNAQIIRSELVMNAQL